MGFNTAFIKEAQTDFFWKKPMAQTQGPKTETGVKPYTKTNDFQLFRSVSLRLSSLITPLPRLKPYTLNP